MLGSGYFLYENYYKYKDSENLVKYTNHSNIVSKLILNLSNEKIKSDIFVITKNSIPFLKEQLYTSRKKTDKIIEKIQKKIDKNIAKELDRLSKDICRKRTYQDYLNKIVGFQCCKPAQNCCYCVNGQNEKGVNCLNPTAGQVCCDCSGTVMYIKTT